MSDIILLANPTSVAEMVANAKSVVLSGDIDPLTAYINIQKMAKAIDEYGKDKDIRRVTLNALELYGQKTVTKGDAKLEISEVGTKYDYAATNDQKIAELYAMKKALDAEIKEREAYLKALPSSGVQVVDGESGEVNTLYPPVKTSTTWIRTTFAK